MSSEKTPTRNNEKKPPLNDYARYSALSFQMLAIILLGVFGGRWLDRYFELEKPVLTAVLSIVCVVLAVIYAVKVVLREN